MLTEAKTLKKNSQSSNPSCKNVVKLREIQVRVGEKVKKKKGALIQNNSKKETKFSVQ